MNDHDKSDEEKMNKEKYDLVIDPVCSAGTIKVPKEEKKENKFSDWG